MTKKWSIQEVWNKQVKFNKSEPKERNYISASDLGKSMIDIYLKMKATPETDPYDERVLRTFSAGNEFHHLIRKVFEKAGILLGAEERVVFKHEDFLPVFGYYDILAGGKPDWEKAKQNILDYGFSEWIEKRTLALVDYLANEITDELEKYVYEVKSVNSMAFWAYNKGGRGYLKDAYEHHKLQCFAYLKGLNIEEGRILYVSKDDLTLLEKPVYLNDKNLEEKFLADLKDITYYYNNDILPPKESDIVFDKLTKKYVPNWKIERSVFFTKITGMKKEDWLKQVKKQCEIKNKELK